MVILQLECEDRRWIILNLLKRSIHGANSSFIQQGLERYTHSVSREQLHLDLLWLQGKKLISTERMGSVMFADLTPMGVAISQGLVTIKGIKDPKMALWPLPMVASI